MQRWLRLGGWGAFHPHSRKSSHLSKVLKPQRSPDAYSYLIGPGWTRSPARGGAVAGSWVGMNNHGPELRRSASIPNSEIGKTALARLRLHAEKDVDKQ